MGFPYIYIYCISISRVFSCFLTFFARFWILSIFCVVSPGKSLFFDVFWKSIPSLRYSHFLDSIFSVPSKEMEFSFLSIFYLFDFFIIVLLFLDRLIFYLYFLSFFILFLSILFFHGSCRMWHQSGDFFFAKNPKKSKKVEKRVKKGVQKKGSKLDLFVPPPKNTKNRVF